MTALRILLVLAAAVGPCALAACSREDAPPATEREPRPNIVVILTDDQPVRSLDAMQAVQQRLVARGALFDAFLINDPICCPSRVTILQGQYRHNHQLPEPRPGCALPFFERGEAARSVGALIQAHGYRTGFVGKFLNRHDQYLEAVGPDAEGGGVMAGWDDYHVTVERAYWNFELHSNGEIVRYPRPGALPAHQTDVFARLAVRFIEAQADGDAPFFLFVSTDAPHWPANAAFRHESLFQDAKAPRVPSFNEADVSDKAVPARRVPLEPEDIASTDQRWAKQQRSLAGVDDLVASVLGAIEAAGVDERTYVFFLSDHGVHFGEHRVYQGKDTPYEESVTAPLVVRGPDIAPGRRIDALAANVDVLPTLLDIVGAERPAHADGRSWLPLLRGEVERDAWRQAFVLESPDLPRNEGMPPFVALRTERFKWIEFEGGARELYDLENDPFELENLAASAAVPEGVRQRLSAWLQRLLHCSGSTCLDAERAPPGA